MFFAYTYLNAALLSVGLLILDIFSQTFSCSLLHRNSGDTERRYHIRYYKTAICVHETDSKG